MGVLLVCLVAVFLLQPTEGCSQITDFTFFDSNNPQAEETCQKCPKCQPGQGLAIQCGSRVPYGTFTGCKKCEVNKTYSKNNDISDCRPCNQCGFKIVLQQCTPTQNSKCADACIQGYKFHPILGDCYPVVPGTKTATTSTKSPTSTKVPTTEDPRTKLQSKPLNYYPTEPPIDSQVSKHVLAKLTLGGCLGGVVVYTVIGFIIYFANKRRHRSQSCEGLIEQEETISSDELQTTGFIIS